MLSGTKPALASVTVWGGLVAIVVALLSVLGYVVSAEDAASATELVEAIAVAAAGVVAIWGRVRATKAIGPAPAPPSGPASDTRIG